MDITNPFFIVFQRPDRLRATTLRVAPGGTIGDLLKDLTVSFPETGGDADSTLAAVGLDYQDRGYVLQAGDEVLLSHRSKAADASAIYDA